MTNYLTNETISKLKMAYAHEMHNMLLYNEISSVLNVNGFRKLAKYYESWASEEKSHAGMVFDFMNQLNIPISNIPFDKLHFTVDFSVITNFAEVTLNTENETTKLYDELLQDAMEFEDSAMLIQFCNKMLNEQIEETGKANDINDMISNIGNNRAMLQLFDNTFGD